MFQESDIKLGQDLIKLIAEIREFKNRENKKTEYQTRYFISSKVQTAEKTLRTCRFHWQIVNKLHWCLDMAFAEDAARVRKDHAPENMAIIRHIAINIINRFRENHAPKKGIKRTQNECAWKPHQRSKILSNL